MNKKIIAIALGITMCMPLAACADDLPAERDIKDVLRVNPVSKVDETGNILMGDVMPFYDGKAFNIYHLRDKSENNSMFYHPIACVSTTDFVHYEDRDVALDYEQFFDSYDAALGTGSFIRDKDGLVHCFYTGHNAELKPIEVIRHAVSTDDQKTWIKDGNFYMQNGQNDFRDPYVYYNSKTDRYDMLVTTRKNGKGVIERYTAPSLAVYPSEWTLDAETFFENDAGTYNMECPAYFEYNGFFYLTYSEQGEQRVTHYRYRRTDGGSWIRPEIDYIDGQGFYAGRPEQANGELYCFAWCAKTTTNEDYGEFDWAGNLVVHKLKQRQNGELYPVIVPGVRRALSNYVHYDLASGGQLKNLEFSGEGFKAKTVEPLKANVQRMRFEFELGSADGDCGLTFGLADGKDNRLGNAVMAFDAKNSAFSYYNDAFSAQRYRKPLVTTPFSFEVGKKYTVDVVVDSQIISVYLDNTLATTVRIYSMQGNHFAFYSNGAKVTFREISIYG